MNNPRGLPIRSVNQTIGAKSCFGTTPRVGRGESIGAGFGCWPHESSYRVGASLVAAQQSVPGLGPSWPALAPAGSARPCAPAKEFAMFWDAADPVVGGNAAGIDPNLGKS